MDFPDHLRVLKHNRDLSAETEARFESAIERARLARERTEALLASLEACSPRAAWPEIEPKTRSCDVDVEQIPYGELIRRSRSLGRVRVGDLLGDDDISDIIMSYQGSQAEFEKENQLDHLDYACAGLAGVVGGIVDIMVVGGTSKELGRKLLHLLGAKVDHDPDATKASFDYVPRRTADARGNHRSNSVSHHLSLGGFIAAVRDVLNGTSTHVIDGEVKTWVNVTKGVAVQLGSLLAGEGPVSVALRILQASLIVLRHWWSDINTTLGLPGPMMLLAKFMEFGHFTYGDKENLTIADLAHKLYGDGLDFRRFIGDSVTVAVNEVLVRSFRFLRAMWDGQSLGDAVLWATKRSGRLRATLLVAHGITAATNAGKVLFINNPLLVNVPQWLAFGRLVMAHLWWSLFNRGAEEHAAHTMAWTESMRGEVRSLRALAARIDGLPVLGVG